MSERVRVLLYHATHDVDGIEAAYHQASEELRGVPGLLDNELLRSVHHPADFVVTSSWCDLDAFHRWEEGTAHRHQTAPLRSYRDTTRATPFGLYRITAAYRSSDVE